MDPKRKSKVSLFDVVDEATFTTKLNIDDGRTTAHGVYISNMSVVNRWNGRPYSQRYYDMLEKRTILPVWHKKREFLKAFKDNQVLIIAGESGSGKTTQVTPNLYYLYQSLFVANFVMHQKRILNCSFAR